MLKAVLWVKANKDAYMIKRLAILLIGLITISSFNDKGELTGVNRKYTNTKVPHGMVLIKGGTFIMGQSDQDIPFAQVAQNRQVTISSFYMDEYEVSNAKYRQFVHWVRDSILLHHFLMDDAYFKIDETNGTRYIDWSKIKTGKHSLWNAKDPKIRDRIKQMFYQGEDRVFGKDELDVRLLRYHYEWFDHRAATLARNDPSKSRSSFIRKDTLMVYPDTTVWLADFSYAQNEPMVEGYFSHPSFDDYPVVGVTWRQAEAFNVWRTKLWENAQKSKKPSARQTRQPFMLPSEAEWEYAARGGKVGMPYPWGGPGLRSSVIDLFANFKSGRGNYAEDGYAYTAPVHSFIPNDFGLYNMAGNVAEWTSSTYNESSSSFVHDLNPTYRYDAKANDPEALKRKTVRGGSWKDVAYFLQNSTRTYEYQDSAKSYIGFRSVSAVAGATPNR
jgi:sulfatase modifying factor 1